MSYHVLFHRLWLPIAILILPVQGNFNPTMQDSVGTLNSCNDCSEENPVNFEIKKSEKTIRFIRDSEFGDTSEILLGRMADVSVDHEGFVYISDRDQLSVHVFHPDGDYLASLGEQGRGPGEFEEVLPFTQVIHYRGDIYVSNMTVTLLHGIHIFNRQDLTYRETIRLGDDTYENNEGEPDGYIPRTFYPVRDGILVGYYRLQTTDYYETDGHSIKYYFHNFDGDILRGPVLVQSDHEYLSVPFQERNYFAHRFPFLRNPLLKVDGRGKIISAWTGEFSIEVYSTDGKLLRMIEHPYERVTLSESAIQEAIEQCDLRFDRGVCRDMVHDSDNLPETWPALNDLLVDDENRLWVSTIVEDFDVYEWWVLEENGELITKFEWPRDEPIEVVKNGYMYTRETDEETDLQQVVRYAIEMD